MWAGTLRQVRPALSRGVSQALADPAGWNQAPVVVSKLSNGVRVATQTTFNEVASVGVFVNSGIRDEARNGSGTAALVGKLALAGTSKRSAGALEEELESLGATLDVQVGREQTSFQASVLGGDVSKGIDIVTDVARNISASNISDSIIRSLQEGETDTRNVISDRLHMTAFRDTALGNTVVGPFDNVGSLGEGAIQEYLARTHVGANTVLAAVGPASHDEVVAAAEAGLGGVAAGSTAGSEAPYFCGAELIYRNDDMGPTAYVSVGWEGVPARSPDAVTFSLMAQIIGNYQKGAGLVPGGISGNRTVNAVANKMGIGCADKFECFNLMYRDTGLFGYYIECDEVAVEHAVGELMFGINLLSFAVTDEEVERAKRELKIKLFGGSGSAANACSTVGQQMLQYGRGVPAADMLLRINALDAEEVKRVAYKYLNDAEICVTALGPLHGMPFYMDLRKQTSMHRY